MTPVVQKNDNGIIEWPRSEFWMNELASRLAKAKAENKKQKSVAINFLGILLRNALFLLWFYFMAFDNYCHDINNKTLIAVHSNKCT